MKRFFSRVAVIPRADGQGITLDDRPLRTPGRVPVVLPAEALACAIADEWRTQDRTIKLGTMPLTRLAYHALDTVAPEQAAVAAAIAAYAASDLLCYRAAEPPALVERQTAHWQPVMDWAAAHYGAVLVATTGILPVPQDKSALAVLSSAVASADPMTLAALRSIVTATGSLLLALALHQRRLSAEEVVAASQLDEAFQAERWGEDHEAAQRRAALAADIKAAAHFLHLLA